MEKRIAVFFAAIAVMLFVWGCPQAAVISGSNGEKLRNALEWAYWQGHGGRGDGRCIYIIYASWCPHCKKLVREVPKIQDRFEIRWILCDAAPGSSFILSGAMPKAFADFIGGKKMVDSSLNRLIATYNKNVFESVKDIVPPVYPVFFLITDKGVRIVGNIAEALQYEKEIAASTTAQNVTYEDLKRYALLDGTLMRGGYSNNSGHSQYLRVFPDHRAPKVKGLQNGRGFAIVEACPARNGKRWLAVPLWKDSMPLFLTPDE